MTLISQDDVLALGAVLLGLAWFGFWADTTRIGRKTSGALWVIVGGLLLANTGVIPLSSPSYDFVGQYLVPVSIPLLLLKADLRKIFKESGAVLFIFFFASLATTLGAIIGFYLLDLGAIGPKVAGVYTGGWNGGSMNFVAVSQAVEMTPSEFSIALSANSPVSIMALMILVSLPSFALIRTLIPSTIIDNTLAEKTSTIDTATPVRLQLNHLSGALALSFVICALSYTLASAIGYEQYSILIVTTLAVVVANCFPKKLAKVEGDFELGILIMYVFFAAVGASTSLTTFLDSAINLFVYSIVIIVIHLLFILSCAKLLKFDLAETIIASAAAIVGPAPAAAIATARGWKELVTPAIMCGIFGYVIANFIGVSVTHWLNPL